MFRVVFMAGDYYEAKRESKRPSEFHGWVVGISKEHLLEKVPISDLCRKHNLQPTIFYRWQKQFFENGEKAFQNESLKSRAEPLQERVVQLEDKLTRKHEVLSELMEEHLRLKKTLGEL